MITEKEFTKLITDYKAWSRRMNSICDVLNINIYEADWIDYTYSLFENTLNLLFTDSAVDTITWWLYEKDGNPSLGMCDDEDNEIPTDTIKDLWEIVKSNRK